MPERTKKLTYSNCVQSWAEFLAQTAHAKEDLPLLREAWYHGWHAAQDWHCRNPGKIIFRGTAVPVSDVFRKATGQ